LSEDDEDDDDEETEGSSDDDSSDDDSDIGAVPPIKRCKVLGTYWWQILGLATTAMYRADRSALGAIGSPFVMVFPMNGILHFNEQLSRSRFTGSRWQRIGPFPQSADPHLSRSLNQFHLLLKSGTFPEQIYTGS
jgi:hypothetical protein